MGPVRQDVKDAFLSKTLSVFVWRYRNEKLSPSGLDDALRSQMGHRWLCGPIQLVLILQQKEGLQ